MAVNSITFGNVNSADYGIYISGEGVFDAPKRAVEMVSIPGRNGALAIDQGYYENIVVTYPAHNYEPEMSDFKENLSAFRNALASQIGYQRLSDTFHPNEYRMAVFDEGLDINPIKYNTASQFDIKFDCKPQRFLKSGETEETVASGTDITNPTQYEAKPLLMVEGYGHISFNGFDIELENAVMGNVHYAGNSFRVTIPRSMYNIGDEITVSGPTINNLFKVTNSRYRIRDNSAHSASDTNAYFNTHVGRQTSSTVRVLTEVSKFTLHGGVADTKSNTATATIGLLDTTTSTNKTATVTSTQAVTTTADSEGMTITVTNSNVITYTTPTLPIKLSNSSKVVNSVDLDSTVSILGHPTYIDCDVGECYRIDDGEYVSLNGKVTLGSDLPVLAVGENEITFDNTITELKIAPNWWKL